MSQDHDTPTDTDTILSLDVAPKSAIVVTSRLGKLSLSPEGLTIDGTPETFDGLPLKAGSFNGYPLKFRLDADRLTLVAQHGENWGYEHPLGPLAPTLQKDPRLNRLILIANTRLSLWLDSRS